MSKKRFAERKDDDRNDYYWLLTLHYYFVQDFNNIKYERKPNSYYSYLWTKHDVLNKLLSIDKNLADSYWLKEQYIEFNFCGTYEEVLYKIDDFIEKFKKTHYEEMRNFGFLLVRWKYKIINSFLTIDGNRMSNGSHGVFEW